MGLQLPVEEEEELLGPHIQPAWGEKEDPSLEKLLRQGSCFKAGMTIKALLFRVITEFSLTGINSLLGHLSGSLPAPSRSFSFYTLRLMHQGSPKSIQKSLWSSATFHRYTGLSHPSHNSPHGTFLPVPKVVENQVQTTLPSSRRLHDSLNWRPAWDKDWPQRVV